MVGPLPGRPPGPRTYINNTININNNNTTLETEYKAEQAYQRLVGLIEEIGSILVSKQHRTPMKSYKKDHQNIPRN